MSLSFAGSATNSELLSSKEGEDSASCPRTFQRGSSDYVSSSTKTEATHSSLAALKLSAPSQISS